MEDDDLLLEETYEDVRVQVHGVLCPEGIRTRDGRRFAENSLWWNKLPLTLLYQDKTAGGHDDSVRVGKIEEIIRKDGLLYWQGSLLDIAVTDDVVQQIAEQVSDGLSVDLFDVTTEVQDADGNIVDEDYVLAEGADPSTFETVFTKGELGGATIVAFPAFREAYIALGPLDAEIREEAMADVEDLDTLVASASFDTEEFIDVAPGKTEDGPGWLTHPVDTNRLRNYWVRGKGALKIGWGTPGDFNRCRALLAPYVKPQHLSGYCANRHYDALKTWPGRHAARPDTYDAEEPYTLTASGVNRLRPPAEWFEDPRLVGPSPLTITEDGRVFGHAATWDSCHISYPGNCTPPPRSPSNYSFFRTGAVLTEEGTQVPIGTITMDTGHPEDETLTAAAAVAHYDNTGTQAMYVAAGEDQYGIWVAGCVAPDMDEEKIMKARAAKLSGDWRAVRGNLEMVAVLAVNTGGFLVPRSYETSEGVLALVAAGVVPRGVELTTPSTEITDAVQAELDRREAAKQAKEALAAVQARAKGREQERLKGELSKIKSRRSS